MARAVTAFARRLVDPGLGPDACDFVFGNPQEQPLRGLVEALIRHAEPRDVHWFGCQRYDPVEREAVASALSRSRGRPYEPADIFVTAGGFGVIASALLAILEVGDEVIYPRPGWFNYGALTRGAAGTPAPVDLAPGSYDLNVEEVLIVSLLIVPTACMPSTALWNASKASLLNLRLVAIVGFLVRRPLNVLYTN